MVSSLDSIRLHVKHQTKQCIIGGKEPEECLDEALSQYPLPYEAEMKLRRSLGDHR